MDGQASRTGTVTAQENDLHSRYLDTLNSLSSIHRHHILAPLGVEEGQNTLTLSAVLRGDGQLYSLLAKNPFDSAIIEQLLPGKLRATSRVAEAIVLGDPELHLMQKHITRYQADAIAERVVALKSAISDPRSNSPLTSHAEIFNHLYQTVVGQYDIKDPKVRCEVNLYVIRATRFLVDSREVLFSLPDDRTLGKILFDDQKGKTFADPIHIERTHLAIIVTLSDRDFDSHDRTYSMGYYLKSQVLDPNLTGRVIVLRNSSTSETRKHELEHLLFSKLFSGYAGQDLMYYSQIVQMVNEAGSDIHRHREVAHKLSHDIKEMRRDELSAYSTSPNASPTLLALGMRQYIESYLPGIVTTLSQLPIDNREKALIYESYIDTISENAKTACFESYLLARLTQAAESPTLENTLAPETITTLFQILPSEHPNRDKILCGYLGKTPEDIRREFIEERELIENECMDFVDKDTTPGFDANLIYKVRSLAPVSMLESALQAWSSPQRQIDPYIGEDLAKLILYQLKRSAPPMDKSASVPTDVTAQIDQPTPYL